MIEQLAYLVDELCAGVEIYYSGRIGGQYLKAAFILCDDYTELTSKLFLLCDDRTWSDRAGGVFKNYHAVKVDLEAVFAAKRPEKLETVRAVHERMGSRRERRNRFFHSADLLDLNVTQRMCLESFCDLFDYGLTLFGDEWAKAVGGARNLETYELLLRLERAALRDPAVSNQLMKVLQDWPRNSSSGRRAGIQVATHPEDLHLRLAVINGGSALRDRLRALLTPA